MHKKDLRLFSIEMNPKRNPIRGVFCFPFLPPPPPHQVRFVMNESTTLGDLLELQLHRVEDEVKNIVDKAVKEMGIEKVGRG